jgi:hypothetical protein
MVLSLGLPLGTQLAKMLPKGRDLDWPRLYRRCATAANQRTVRNPDWQGT